MLTVSITFYFNKSFLTSSDKALEGEITIAKLPLKEGHFTQGFWSHLSAKSVFWGSAVKLVVRKL